MENANFVETTYTTVQADGRGSYNQIRARRSSLDNMSGKYNNFRLTKEQERAAAKLEEAKQDLVTSQYPVEENGQLTEAAQKSLIAKTTAVATLESFIDVMTGIPVRSNFIASRAIKLRDNMIGNFRHNSEVAYLVANEQMQSQIFDTGEVAEPEMPIVPEPVPEAVPQEPVAAPLNEAPMATVDTPQEVEPVMIPQEPDSVAESVADEDMAPIEVPDRGWDSSEETIQPVTVPEVAEVQKDTSNEDSTFVSSDDIDNALTEFMNKPEDKKDMTEDTNEMPVIAGEPEEKELDEVKDDLEAVKVTQNQSSEAKVDKFDEEGEQRYVYTPLTEEEIEKAKSKLNIAEDTTEPITEEVPVVAGGEAEDNNTNEVKEEPFVPLIVPDRPLEEKPIFEKNQEEEQELHFDYSNVTKSDVEKIISNQSKPTELKALIEDLKTRKAELEAAKRERQQSEEKLESISKKVPTVEQALAESEAKLDGKIKELRSKGKDLSKEIESINQATSGLRDSIAEKEKYISEQERKTEETNQLIEEMDDAILTVDDEKAKKR